MHASEPLMINKKINPTPALSEQPESEKRQDLFGEVREKAEKKGKICLESAYSG